MTNIDPANNYSDAFARAERVTRDDLYAMISADDNPRIFEYRRRPVIAMDAIAYANGSGYVGFEYCDRAGYPQTRTAPLERFVKVGKYKSLDVDRHEFRPTVFGFKDSEGVETYVWTGRHG